MDEYGMMVVVLTCQECGRPNGSLLVHANAAGYQRGEEAKASYVCAECQESMAVPCDGTRTCASFDCVQWCPQS